MDDDERLKKEDEEEYEKRKKEGRKMLLFGYIFWLGCCVYMMYSGENSGELTFGILFFMVLPLGVFIYAKYFKGNDI